MEKSVGMTRKTMIGTKGMRNVAWLLAGMLLASLPGIVLAPYGINYFDEPYQILNAMDWRNAAYSPLSAWLAHFYGEAFDWRYLFFRHLTLALNFLTIFICSAYALRIARYRWLVMAGAWMATLFFTGQSGIHTIYGWDSWSYCFVAAGTVILLSLLRRFSYGKLVLLSLVAAATFLLRLPNVVMAAICVLTLTARPCVSSPGGLAKGLRQAGLFLLLFIGFSWLLIAAIYGSAGNYLQIFSANPIDAHSPLAVVTPFFTRGAIAMICALFTWGVYSLFAHTAAKGGMARVVDIVGVTTLMVAFMLPERGSSIGGEGREVAGIVLLLLWLALRRAMKEGDRLRVVSVAALFLMGAVTAAGSNLGFTKYMAWPLLPLALAYGVKKLDRTGKTFCIMTVVAFGVVFLCNKTRPFYFDGRLSQLTYRFDAGSGVLAGMVTTPEKGAAIEETMTVARPYREKGYEILPLKGGNEYIWEYIYGWPNKYQRNLFENWYAFNDPGYVDAIMADLRASRHPVLVMFMQNNDPASPWLMCQRLDEEAEMVADTPWYTFWVYHRNLVNLPDNELPPDENPPVCR